MKLPQRYNRGTRIAGNGFRQQAAILRNSFAVIRFGKTQIQFARSILATIGPARAAPPRAESMPEPFVDGFPIAPRGNLQQIYAVSKHRGNRSSKSKFLLRRGILALSHACASSPPTEIRGDCARGPLFGTDHPLTADFGRVLRLGKAKSASQIRLYREANRSREQMGPPSGEPAREAFCMEGGPEGVVRRGLISDPQKE